MFCLTAMFRRKLLQFNSDNRRNICPDVFRKNVNTSQIENASSYYSTSLYPCCARTIQGQIHYLMIVGKRKKKIRIKRNRMKQPLIQGLCNKNVVVFITFQSLKAEFHSAKT